MTPHPGDRKPFSNMTTKYWTLQSNIISLWEGRRKNHKCWFSAINLRFFFWEAMISLYLVIANDLLID